MRANCARRLLREGWGGSDPGIPARRRDRENVRRSTRMSGLSISPHQRVTKKFHRLFWTDSHPISGLAAKTRGYRWICSLQGERPDAIAMAGFAARGESAIAGFGFAPETAIPGFGFAREIAIPGFAIVAPDQRACANAGRWRLTRDLEDPRNGCPRRECPGWRRSRS